MSKDYTPPPRVSVADSMVSKEITLDGSKLVKQGNGSMINKSPQPKAELEELDFTKRQKLLMQKAH